MSVRREQLQVNVNGLVQNSALVLTSNKYHYLVWFILGITLISMGLYAITSTSTTATNSFIVMVSLLSVYFVSIWMNDAFIRYQ